VVEDQRTDGQIFNLTARYKMATAFPSLQGCNLCKQIDLMAMGECQSNVKDWEMRFKKAWQTHCYEVHGIEKWNPSKTSHTGNGAHQGQWAFTLTKSPTDELTVEDMIKAVKKVLAQQSNPVKYFAWYLEYTDEATQKHPHIHGMYEREGGGRIEAKHWRRAWKIWGEGKKGKKMGAGFRGGYHRPTRHEERYATYIAKQKGIHDSCLPPVENLIS